MAYCSINLGVKPISVYYNPLVKIGRGGRTYILPYGGLWSDISLTNYYKCFLPINFK